jgi:hypothetical protein
MKKVFLAIAVASFFVACNAGETASTEATKAVEEVKTAVDSTVKTADSTIKAVADSTVKAVTDSIKK